MVQRRTDNGCNRPDRDSFIGSCDDDIRLVRDAEINLAGSCEIDRISRIGWEFNFNLKPLFFKKAFFFCGI
jgi:hypothetical protein